MPYLERKDKEELKSLAVTERGEIVRKLIEDNINELGNVDTIDSDPIISRRMVIKHLEANLLAYFKEKQPTEQEEVETYE